MTSDTELWSGKEREVGPPVEMKRRVVGPSLRQEFRCSLEVTVVAVEDEFGNDCVPASGNRDRAEAEVLHDQAIGDVYWGVDSERFVDDVSRRLGTRFGVTSEQVEGKGDGVCHRLMSRQNQGDGLVADRVMVEGHLFVLGSQEEVADHVIARVVVGSGIHHAANIGVEIIDGFAKRRWLDV